jgi:hypothetical protein
MLIKKWLLFSFVFVVSAALGYLIFAGKSPLSRDAIEVDWRLLGELDYTSGVAQGELAKLDGKEVRVPGFMVPLEDNQKSVVEFLLVPAPQMCIHVPAPPPNQMVLIEMDGKEHTKIEFGPIWVYGTLRIKSKRHTYGETAFVMEGHFVEPYQ